MPANGTVLLDQERPTSEYPPPLPGARTALLLLLCINLFNYIDRQVLAAVLPDIEREFFPNGGTDVHTKLGALSTAFMVSYMLAAPLFGWLADRMSRWLLIGIGVILWTLASGGSGLASAYLILFLTRCLVGIGEAGYGPAAPTVISDLYPVRIRGSVLAWFYAAIPVGSALGYVLGGMVAKQTGDWRWAFYLVVPPGLLLGLWCFLMKEPARGQADTGGQTGRAHLRDYLVLLRIPSYVLNTLGMTAMTFAIGGVGFWMPTYIQHRSPMLPEVGATAVGLTSSALGQGPFSAVSAVLAGRIQSSDELASINLIFGAIVVVSGLGATLLGGLAGDKLRARFPGSYFLVSGCSMLVGFPMFLMVLWTPFPWAWIFIFGAVFSLFFNTGPTNTILANVTPPSVRATAFALNILIIHALGDAMSPTVIGYVSDHSSLNQGFLLVSGMICLGGLLWLWGARYLERDTALAPFRLGGTIPSGR